MPGVSHPLSFPLISTVISIYHKLHIFFLMRKERVKIIQELVQGHPVLCRIQNQVCLALIYYLRTFF